MYHSSCIWAPGRNKEIDVYKTWVPDPSLDVYKTLESIAAGAGLWAFISLSLLQIDFKTNYFMYSVSQKILLEFVPLWTQR